MEVIDRLEVVHQLPIRGEEGEFFQPPSCADFDNFSLSESLSDSLSSFLTDTPVAVTSLAVR